MSRFIASICVVIGLLCARNAVAGIDDELKNMFDGMVVTASPGYAETQRRGVFQGGGIYVRSRVLHPKLIHFDPPSTLNLQGPSCNGINFYGGSISFIQKEQIVAYLRTIASNAAGYIFSLALSSACEKCAQWINALDSKIQQLNKALLDSCSNAKQLVHLAGINEKTMDASVDQLEVAMSTIGNTVDTVAGNLWEAMFPSDSGAPTDQTESLKDTGQLKAQMNIVWDVIRKQDLKAWFSDDTQEMANILLAFIGPIVIERRDDDLDGTFNLEPINYGASITFKDMMWGTGSDTVTHWNCDLSDSCLKPATPGGVAISITGLVNHVKAILNGGEVHGTHTIGLVNKLLTNTGPFSKEELSFLNKTRLPVLAFLRNLSEKRIVPTQMVDTLAEYIARDMLNQWVFETIQMARKGLANTPVTGGRNEFQRRLTELEKEIKLSDEQISTRRQDEMAIYQLYSFIMSNLGSEKQPIKLLLQDSSAAGK